MTHNKLVPRLASHQLNPAVATTLSATHCATGTVTIAQHSQTQPISAATLAGPAPTWRSGSNVHGVEVNLFPVGLREDMRSGAVAR